MIIDFHTHAFPDKLAPIAIGKLSQNSHAKNHTDGTVGDLLCKMNEWGIDKSVICNIATNAHQMKKVNDFAISADKLQNKIIAFGSLNPDATEEELNEEAERLYNAGIKGIKIHPDFQNHKIEESCYEPIFELAIKYSFPVVTHAGKDSVSPDLVHAEPADILKVVKKFPKLKLIAAHLGAKDMWEDSFEILAGNALYLDTAVIFGSGITKLQAERIIKKHGADRILFGSDCPWSDAGVEADFIKSLDLSENDKELIFYKNACRLLNLSI